MSALFFLGTSITFPGPSTNSLYLLFLSTPEDNATRAEIPPGASLLTLLAHIKKMAYGICSGSRRGCGNTTESPWKVGKASREPWKQPGFHI